MVKFSKYRIKPIVDSKKPSLGTFIISPLEQGYGTTLGNALRRILLSSIPSAAVFAIKVPHATHEHTAIKGVVEDLSHIILNIKRLSIVANNDVVNFDELEKEGLEKWPTLKIERKTKGEVFASDIVCPPGFEIKNPDLKICELTEDVNFSMELYIRVARGFVTANENQELISGLNIIAIDSQFSPILRVNFKIDEEKTSRKGLSDHLEMNIATNGTIAASDAFALAAQILKFHLEPIVELNEIISNYQLEQNEQNLQKQSVLTTSIDDLELTMRSYNSLKRCGIHTVQELIDKSKSEVERIRNLGKKSLKEIIRKLAERGLSFKDN